MNKTILIIILVITGIFIISEATSVSKFELHAKLSQVAYDNNISYGEAREYCGEALSLGHECYITNK